MPAPTPKVQDHVGALSGGVEIVPIGESRQSLGDRLVASWTTVPHAAQFDEVDLAAIETERDRLRPEAMRAGISLNELPFILSACAHALRTFADVNASLDASGSALLRKKYYHLAFAADLPVGLPAPVIHDADTLSLIQIARAIDTLSKRARSGTLSAADTQGASFTVSMLGTTGGTGFVPIIHAPEVATLGVARATQRVVEANGKFVTRRVLPLTLAYDQRVIDDMTGGRFLAAVREHLSSPPQAFAAAGRQGRNLIQRNAGTDGAA